MKQHGNKTFLASGIFIKRDIQRLRIFGTASAYTAFVYELLRQVIGGHSIHTSERQDCDTVEKTELDKKLM